MKNNKKIKIKRENKNKKKIIIKNHTVIEDETLICLKQWSY